MVESESSWVDDKESIPSPGGSSAEAQQESDWKDDVVPPEHDNRTLVVCFDGTGDKFDADNSNVVQFVSLLKKDNKREQMVYYQAGIGTYSSSHGLGIFNAINRRVMRTLDQAIAWSLPLHTQAGYEFLMQNYQYGDKICIFGFSRGAYTARALAGMLTRVGLLPADNREQIPFAYKIYKLRGKNGKDQSRLFKETFSVSVTVDFLGVWDTVDSVGLISRRLPLTKANGGARVYRHAVSLDEHRAKFMADLLPHSGKGKKAKKQGTKEHEKGSTPHKAGKKPKDSRFQPDILEVWFSGCHCDVGGGAVANDTRHALARIPLRWMIRQCFLAGTGIMFDGKLLAKIGLNPRNLDPVVPRPEPITLERADRSRIASDHTGTVMAANTDVVLTEEEEDLADILSPINDELFRSKSWWFLELLPVKHKHQNEDGSWAWRTRANFGKGRHIPRDDDYTIRVHRTVKLRMEAEEALIPGRRKYVPRAKPWEGHRLEWVD